MPALRLLLATVAVVLALPVASAFAIPPNDSRDAPVFVAGNGQSINATNQGATYNPTQDQDRAGTGTHSVWYRWTAPQHGLVVMTTSSAAFDPAIGVYAATDCCTWRKDLDSGAGNAASVWFYVRAGQTYDILVDGETAADWGTFTLNVTFDSTPSAPVNDDFADAQALNTTSFEEPHLNLLFATEEAGEPNHRGVFTSHSLWYTYKPTTTGGAYFDAGLCYDSDYFTEDPVVAVYTGATLATLVEVTYTDDGSGSCPRSTVKWMANAGVTYRIAVDAGPGIVAESPIEFWQDIVKPTVSFGVTNVVGPNGTITWSLSEGGTTTCKLDGVAVACGGGQYKLNNAAGGNHKLEVTPTDYNGNVGSTFTKNFSVEATPPETQITSAPPAETNTPNWTITFSSNDGAATFQCKHSGQANWANCTSGYAWKPWYAKNDVGTFEVRAVDVYGNTDPTPAVRTWKQDFNSPIIQNVGSGSNSAPVNTPLKYEWTANEPATFECSMDNEPFKPCTSPHTVPGIGTVGGRYLTVRATDAAGNTTESKRYGYHSSAPGTATTTATTTTGTSTTARTTTGGIRPVLASLIPAKSTITRKALLKSGLKVTGRCTPRCAFFVELRAGRKLLAMTSTTSTTVLKIKGTIARKAVSKLRKGTRLTLTGRGAGMTRTMRVRISG